MKEIYKKKKQIKKQNIREFNLIQLIISWEQI